MSSFLWTHFLLGYITFQACPVSGQFNFPPSIPGDVDSYFQVTEGDQAVGTTVFTLRAVDQDSTDVLQFRSATDETESLISLGPATKGTDGVWSCDLSLKIALDRDNSPQTRKLYFIVSDGSAEVAINVIMIIGDINDNPPSFVNLPYKASVPEDLPVGSVVFRVSATDPDLNSGGTIVYTIQANLEVEEAHYREMFTIHPYQGEITLLKSLDYEDLLFYHFKVSATDEGNPQCPGQLCPCNASEAVCDGDPVDFFLTVEDVQDSPPVFDRISESYSVPEDSPVGYSILQVRAVDGDRAVAVPNQIKYSLGDGNYAPFTLDENNGTISVAQTLDAADPTSNGGLYVFSVVATEDPPPANLTSGSTSITVSIIVTDVDDHAPTFSEATYSATVIENTPSGAPLTVTPDILVTDSDQGENSRFRLSVEKDGAPYNGFSTLPSEDQVIQSSSSVLLTVGDSTELDFETSPSITFQLVLTEEHESGAGPSPPRPPATATVTLTIQDANDNSPEFPADQPRTYNVSEADGLGHVIGNITAEDIDSGDFGSVFFTLEAEGHDGEFAISQQGALSVAGSLDRETRSSYSLVVIATDSPASPVSQRRSSRLPVTILVEDVNDLDPQWTQVIPQVSVQESAELGTKITDLIAVDMDQGQNGQIEYSIAPGTNGSTLFSVREVEGRAELIVGTSLIGHSGQMLVRVVAIDNGEPPRSSQAEVTVLVIDENQFDPVFINPNQSQYDVTTGSLPEEMVDEELEINEVITQLQATDGDQGENGEINYFLEPTLNKDFEYFTVDRETGYLRVARRLDRETKSEYEIQVKAEDLGKPAARASTITMRIALRDIDDNGPTFAGQAVPLMLSVVEEDATASIGQLSATDADSDPANRNICYYLYGGDFLTSLSLDKYSGQLSMTSAVDRETTEYFDVVVKASSRCDMNETSYVSGLTDSSSTNSTANTNSAGSSSSLSSYNATDTSLQWIRVTTVDVNDNPPVFTHDTLSAGVLYDVPTETVIMDVSIQVEDADTEPNSQHQYRLLSITPVLEEGDQLGDTSTQAFTITPNGTLLTNTLFPSDLLGYYLLVIEAYDFSGLKSTTDVRVYLISNLQRVMLVFDMRPNEVEEIKQEFVNRLSDILGLNIVMDRVLSHTTTDGSKDGSMSDAYLHGWYRDTGEMVPAADLRRMLDFNQEVRALLYEYGVIEAQTIEQASTGGDDEELTRLFAIIIAVLGILVIVLVLVLVRMVRMYRRRLRAATTMAYASPKEQEMYEHPGTNKYYAAENPLYGKELKHAVLDEDKTSHNSLDLNAVDPPVDVPLPPPPPPLNEEQEVVLQISDTIPPPGGEDRNPQNPSQSRTDGSYGEDSTSDKLPPYSHRGDNHIATLDHVLQAYSNSTFEDGDEDDDDEEEEDESIEGKEAVNGEELTSKPGDNSLSDEKRNRIMNGVHGNNPFNKPSSNNEPSSNSSKGQAPPPPPRSPGRSLYIPGLGRNYQEGVTRFSDENLQGNPGYSETLSSRGSHLDYTDI